jgi:hypothetical protein
MKLSEITQEQLDDICTYMTDEIRERLHSELAPCTPQEFLKAYLKEDEELLEGWYDIFGQDLEIDC